jgi:hypothetical protein
MQNETIDAIDEDYARGRLQAIQDLIERLDRECAERNGAIEEMNRQAGSHTTMENIVEKMRAAIEYERLMGVIAASKIAVDMFSEEAKAANAVRADGENTR